MTAEANAHRSPARDSPRYVRGHAVTLAMVAMGTAIYACMWFWYWRANKRRAAGHMSDKHRRMTEEELAELGDDSPRYRYTV